MQEAELFHAYIVGGDRESARAHIAEMLVSFPDAAIVPSEQVNFTIESARALRAMQELRTETGKRTVYIVYADFISPEAENALLKTLEEPVERTHIILAIPKPDVLLPTLLSRVRVVLPKRAVGGTADAEKFLALSRADRLALIAKLVEKSEDEEAAAEVRERALSLLDSLEKSLSEFPEKNAKKLGSLLRLKKYLYTPGASSRILLETIALTI